MSERLHFDRGVDLLIEWDGQHSGARVRAVICLRAEDARHAARLAASMGVPLQHDSGAPAEQAAVPTTATRS